MLKEHLKGGLNEAKGEAKEAIGKVTGNKKLETEGKVDQAEGEAQHKAGNISDKP